MSSPTCLLLVLLAAAMTPEAFSVTVTPSTTRVSFKGTPNFSLDCTTADGTSSQISELHRIRILKFEMNRWNSIMEMDSDWIMPKGRQGVKGSGVVSEDQSSGSLQALWDKADNLTIGEYACDVMGYSAEGQGVWQRSPSVIVDLEVPLSLFDLLTMVDDSNKRIDNAVEEMSDRVDQAVQSLETSLQDKVDSILSQKETETSGEIRPEDSSEQKPEPTSPKPEPESTTNTMSAEDSKPEKLIALELPKPEVAPVDQWPAGKYGLLQPVTGCPEDLGVEWKTGWRKHHTESTMGNRDRVSSPAHMKTEIMTTAANFMFQYFCTVLGSSEGGDWPAGSYCINKKGECPAGFDFGYIHWDDEDTENKNERGGDLPAHSFGNTFSRLSYCCRNDSAPATPIKLPTGKPFFLYRYQGQCQAVEGMQVINEYMLFNTDCCGSRYQPVTPDGKDALPDVKLELCYYARL